MITAVICFLFILGTLYLSIKTIDDEIKEKKTTSESLISFKELRKEVACDKVYYAGSPYGDGENQWHNWCRVNLNKKTLAEMGRDMRGAPISGWVEKKEQKPKKAKAPKPQAHPEKKADPLLDIYRKRWDTSYWNQPSIQAYYAKKEVKS